VAVIGAVFFMISDSLPAWDRFAGCMRVPALLVLSGDWLAQRYSRDRHSGTDLPGLSV
jgi:hypothetical protein